MAMFLVDIVMSLEDILAYIFSETVRILTKLGRGMGTGKSGPVKFLFLQSSLQWPRKRGRTLNLFRDKYHAPVWSLPLYGFPRYLTGVCESLSARIVSQRNFDFFPLRGRFSLKNRFWDPILVALVNFRVNISKTIRLRKTFNKEKNIFGMSSVG